MTEVGSKLRITVLTQWFEPEPAYRGAEFARDLSARGYDVDVVTGFPNYPGGAVYEGYKIRLMQKENLDGISLVRLALFPSHGHDKIGRSINYISFMISVWVHLIFRRRRVDVVYVYHPPITVGLAAVLAKPLRRFGVVLDIQDLWPDTLDATGMVESSTLAAMVNAICNFVYRRCAQIVVQSDGFRKRLIERGVQPAKLTKVHNWAPKDILLGSIGHAVAGFRPDDDFRILFAGNMGKAQSLSSTIDAAKLLVDLAPKVTIYLMGDGTERAALEQAVKRERLPNVVFLPRVPLDRVGAFLARADALLVQLRTDPLFDITIPSKTQAYLAMGKPLIMAVGGEAAELVLTAGAGVVAKPGDPESLAHAIIQLSSMTVRQRERMGLRGQSLYERAFAQAIGMAQFERVFQTAQGGGHDK